MQNCCRSDERKSVVVGQVRVSQANLENILHVVCWLVCMSVVVRSRVPGSVFTDLMRGGILGDPYYRFNDVAYRHYCYLDWNSSKTFTGCLLPYLLTLVFFELISEILFVKLFGTFSNFLSCLV